VSVARRWLVSELARACGRGSGTQARRAGGADDAHDILDRHAIEYELALAHLTTLLEISSKLFLGVHA
jgi:hypothetical protein